MLNATLQVKLNVPIILGVWATMALPVLGFEQAGAPLKYQRPQELSGKIFSSDRKQLLYNFTRRSTRSGEHLQVTREYTYPNGKVAAREVLKYTAGVLVSFELDDLQNGTSGKARIERDSRRPNKGRILFDYRSDPSHSQPKTDSESLRADTLVNDMVAVFLADHWTELSNGKELKCRYIVIPRLETVGFTFRRHSEERDFLIIKMEATSPIIAALIDPLYFKIEKQPPHRVVEYTGRTTPKIRSGSSWKDLDALTVFDWSKAE